MLIYQYSREQAIAGGTLIDVISMAKEAGFRYPVVVTRAVWDGYIVPSEHDARKWGQDTQGRLWDTLWMLRIAIRSGGSGSTVMFQVCYRLHGRLKKVPLKAVVGTGDDMEPVITIMLPDED